MKGVYLQSKSPYYWIRYYDKLEQNREKRRKSLNTKIEVTPSDWKRYKESKQKKEKPKLQGNSELRKLVASFKSGLAQRDIEARSGVKLIRDLKLSEGFEEFKVKRTVPGSKKQLKEKTIENYKIAVDYFIECSTDKYIYKYNDDDYIKLLHLFEEKNLSINSRSIYTRSLRSLWNYFLEQNYTAKNIIETVDPEEKDPEPIPLEDMFTIIEYLKLDKNYPHHYWIIYFMLLTGCRPSSAIMQLKEDIDFKGKKILIRNIKTGKRKGREFYKFPLYRELYNLLVNEIKIKPGDKGRIFDMYSIVPQNYTWPLSFWKRKIKFLVTAGKINRPYSLKQIRPTLASFLVNKFKMDIYQVKNLLDHTDVKITDKHYVDFNINEVRKDLDEISLEDFLE